LVERKAKIKQKKTAKAAVEKKEVKN